MIVDSIDVGLEQIRRGIAWVFVRYLKELEPGGRAAYAAAVGVPRSIAKTP